MNVLPDVINIFESDDDDDFEFVERRPYTIKNKLDNFPRWDSTEFFERYRLKKDTVLDLLQEIEHRLLTDWNKYVYSF